MRTVQLTQHKGDVRDRAFSALKLLQFLVMASDDAKLKLLKKQVLLDQVELLSDDMGSPERYFPQFRSAGLLDRNDCETIRHLVTTRDKVLKFVDILTEGRQGRDKRPAFDVLVGILNREGVHASVARELQKALAKAKEEELRE